MGVATHRRLGYVLWAVINLLDHPLWNHEWGRVEATRKTTNGGELRPQGKPRGKLQSPKLTSAISPLHSATFPKILA